jgi:hypothetical protein
MHGMLPLVLGVRWVDKNFQRLNPIFEQTQDPSTRASFALAQLALARDDRLNVRARTSPRQPWGR